MIPTFTSILSSRFGKKRLLASAGVLVTMNLAAATGAFCAQVSNIDSALQKLYALAQGSLSETTQTGVHGQIAPVAATTKQSTPGRFDSTNRVLVHVLLNGAATIDAISTQITTLKGAVLDSNATYQHGIIAAYIPTDQIGNCAAIVGVRALTMEYRPEFRVGKYTSQGATVLGTSTVNSTGFRGDGITVGVISDSFNTAYQSGVQPATVASQDVASGDLPVVNVLQDFPGGTDEGRAMCQIVYDEAPHCNIAFATADQSEVGFANNIVALRVQAKANVIVDDVSYYDEPVFSDGLVANAVNTVATSTTFTTPPSVYVSAAGNDGNNGYRSQYRNLTDAQVRKSGNHGNLKLNVTDPASPNYLDPSLTAGGWFNWNPGSGVEPSTPLSAPGPTTYSYAVFLQWDDLFDHDDGITTSFNFLVFDQNGNYLPALSSTSNAFSDQEPIQAIGYLALGTNYQIAITKTTQTDPLAGPIPAAHELALYTTLDGASNLAGKYFYPAPLNVPNIYGHPQADGAIATAAYAYSWRAPLPFAPELENFTSPGPSMIFFDQNSNRLATPIIRDKPEVAGVDGVVTTFFGAPYYNYPFAFFGTSAAAPSVAGIAALMIQKAGGPGSITPASVKQILESSTAPRNSTVEMTQATASSSSGTVTVSALGQTYFGPNYFTASFSGGSGKSVTQLTIDGTASGLIFDTTLFDLGNLKGIAAADISIGTPSATSSKFTITFKKGTFVSGASFGFTLGQYVAGTYTGYTQDEFGDGVEAEDLSFGSTISAKLSSPTTLTLNAPFLEGALTSGYKASDGYGLVNGVTAVGATSTSASSVSSQ